jgi:deoxycytidylate deaminase
MFNIHNIFVLKFPCVITEQQIVQEQILEILPMVSEVNAVSEELNKHKSFEVVLISAAAQEGSGKQGQGTQ